MEVNKKLGLRDTVLALLLTLLQGIPIGETAPNPSPLVGSNWGNPRRYVHLETSTELSNFYLEIKLDGTVRRTTVRSSYSKMFVCLPSAFPGRLFCVSVIAEVSLLCLLRRCDPTQSWDQGARRHPGRQKQPLPVHGPGGKPLQLGETHYQLVIT